MNPIASQDRLYRLLPAYYRQLDPAAGYPLRDLLRVVAGQVTAVEVDIARAYDDLFIETCQPWVAPYLGDLVGYETTYDPAGTAADPLLSPRADVANAIAFRRRKGTAGVLADLAVAVGRWPAVALELADRVARTLPVREAIAPGGAAPIAWPASAGGFHSARNAAARIRRGSPFDRAPRLVDVRRPGSHRTSGQAHPASVGVFVYRLDATPVIKGTPAQLRRHCYTFDPLGRDAPLFHRAEPAGAADDPFAVPAPIPRAALPIPGRPLDPDFQRLYGEDERGDFKSLAIHIRDLVPAPSAKATRKKTSPTPSKTYGPWQAIPAEQITAADLKDWDTERLPDLADDEIAIDPVRGRFVLSSSLSTRAKAGGIAVSYRHGTADTIGAGGHAWEPMTGAIPFPTSSGDAPPNPKAFFDLVNQKIDSWSDQGSTTPSVLIIEINTSAIVHLPAHGEVHPIPPGKTLLIRAGHSAKNRAHRPVFMPQAAEPARLAFQVATRSPTGPVGGRIILEGLLFADVEVSVTRQEQAEPKVVAAVGVIASASVPERPAEVEFRRVTFATRPRHEPKPDSTQPTSARSGLVIHDVPVRLLVRESILGPVRVDRGERAGIPVALDVADSIWDAGCSDRFALTGQNGCHAPVNLTIQRATVRGRLHTHAFDLAADSIFMGLIDVARRQQGEMRYCYYRSANGDRTPRRVQCQPEAAIRQAAECGWPLERLKRAVPVFTTTDPGRPGYFRLAAGTPSFIAMGAADQGEPGAYHRLQQFRRAARLRARLGEFTPTGFDVALIFAT